MQWVQAAKQILYGHTLEDKLIPIPSFEVGEFSIEEFPHLPGRSERFKFSTERVKFPGLGSLVLDEKKAVAFHFFANHELLALEMMAAALLVYRHDTEALIRFKKDLIQTMRDEQKHLKLYLHRMRDFGVEFGDYPLNDYFWKQTPTLKTPERFYALMALTFESANLDFASQYADVFSEIGDEKSANTMNIVLEDEIAHVARGARWLERAGAKDLWLFYLENLPPLLSPNRAKGSLFKPELRKRCGLSSEFIERLSNFDDNYRITTRRTWKAIT